MQHKHEFTDGLCDHCGIAEFLVDPDESDNEPYRIYVGGRRSGKTTRLKAAIEDWSAKVAINDPDYVRMERELDQRDANE